MPDDTILEELPDFGGYRQNIVDLASVRVAAGRLKRGVQSCTHQNLVYSSSQRLIECKDCNRAIEAFDAFMTLTRHFERMAAEHEAKERSADDALKAVVHRRAAKSLERTWRQMAALCPHCRKGILPEDNLGASAVSRELEIARRNRSRQPLPEPPNA